MELLENEVLQVLSFLLPGFLTAWVFHGLTSFPARSQFERLIQALIFTSIIQVLVVLFRSVLEVVGTMIGADNPWTSQASFTSSLVIALILGVVLSKFTNYDIVHALLRKLGVTYQNSFPSEWFSAFARHKTYVVLHLSGERRLYGWPVEWPTDPEKGHFLIVDAEWLTDGNPIKLESVETILIPVAEVEMVEFMKTRSNS